MEYYSVIKNNEIIPCLLKWDELKDLMLSERSQIQTNMASSLSYVGAYKNIGDLKVE